MLGGWSSTCTKLSHYTSWVVFADLFSIHLFIVTKIGGDRPRLYTLVGGLLAHSSSFLGWFHPLFLLWLVTERQAAAPFTIPSAIFFPPQHFMIMIFFCPKWIRQNMEGGIRCWWIYNPANVSDVFPTFCPAAEDRRRALKYLSAAAAQPPIDRSPPPLYLNFLKVFLSLDFITPDG